MDLRTTQPVIFKQMRMLHAGTHLIELKAMQSGCNAVVEGLMVQVELMPLETGLVPFICRTDLCIYR